MMKTKVIVSIIREIFRVCFSVDPFVVCQTNAFDVNGFILSCLDCFLDSTFVNRFLELSDSTCLLSRVLTVSGVFKNDSLTSPFSASVDIAVSFSFLKVSLRPMGCSSLMESICSTSCSVFHLSS